MLSLCLGLSRFSAPSGASLLQFDAPIGSSAISVESHDLFEHWTVTSDQINGDLVGDPKTPSSSVSNAHFTVQLLTLKSDNHPRDQKMYDMFETNKYPDAVLTVTTLHCDQLAPKVAQLITFNGSLTMHGVTCPLNRIPGSLTFIPGFADSKARLIFKTTFVIHLKDYKLKAPHVLFVKVADDQKITVTINAQAR